MDTIVEFIKEFLIPGSITFLLFGLIVGIILLFRGQRTAMWGRRWLILLAGAYWALSTPLFSGLLVSMISSGYNPISDETDLTDVEVIVVLGGGGATYSAQENELSVLSDSSALRVLEGARLYRMLDEPTLIVSGGSNEQAGMLVPESLPMREVLIQLGIPADQILLDNDSHNTHAQAVNLRDHLEDQGRFLLVTSPTHMSRAFATFVAQGLDPIPAVSAQSSEAGTPRAGSLFPDPEALATSRTALREVMAYGYYALRGWFRSAPSTH